MSVQLYVRTSQATRLPKPGPGMAGFLFRSCNVSEDAGTHEALHGMSMTPADLMPFYSRTPMAVLR